MKKLKYYLIIFSLLALFVPRETYAKVSDYYSELKYDYTTLSLKEEYQNEIDLITDYIKNNGIGGHNPNDNKYVIGYDLSTFNTTNKKVILIDISNTNNYIESTYGPYRTSKNVRLNVAMFYQMFNINNGNVIATSGVTSGNSFFYSYFADYNCNPTEENCILDTNHIYYDTSYINEQYSNSVINLRDTYINDNTYYFIPLKVGNTVHLTSTELNTKEFFDSMGLSEPGTFCPEISDQIGEASNVSEFYFNISGDSNVDNHLRGYIDLYSREFVGIGINADAFADITFEWASDNEAENNSFSYNVEWLNDTTNPTYHIEYDVFSGTDEDVYTSIILKVKLKDSNVMLYFRQSVFIFSFTYCNPFNVSYGYVNYKDNSTVTSDPFLENYFNNLSLPSLKFFNNLNTLLPVGPVDSILTIPLQMLNSINSSLSGTCQPININLPYINRNVTLNCQNSFYDSIGATNFVNFVGVVASVLILIKYFIFLYNWLESVLALSHQQLSVWGEASIIDPNWESRG